MPVLSWKAEAPERLLLAGLVVRTSSPIPECAAFASPLRANEVAQTAGSERYRTVVRRLAARRAGSLGGLPKRESGRVDRLWPVEDVPETGFTRVGSDRIAYQVLGEGPLDLVYV